tara:strand:- start:1652 stop:1756 length:105 start_codon:yes stop_codon:yes gene_type:complete
MKKLKYKERKKENERKIKPPFAYFYETQKRKRAI